MSCAWLAMEDSRKISAFSASMLIIKVNWGIGMIAMPFYLHSAGLFAGLLFFIISMLLAADAAMLMHRLSETIGDSTYVTLIQKAHGPKAGLLAAACVLLAFWGSAVAWLKFIGDNLARFLPLPLTGTWYIAILCIPLMSCAWLNEIKILERFSFLGLLAGQLFVILMLILSASHWAMWPSYFAQQPFLRIGSFPVAMGIAAFCNEGMVVMASEVSASMHVPYKFKSSMVWAVTYFSANYLLMSLCGDFLYSFLAHDVVAQEVTLSKAFTVTIAHRVAVLLYVFQLLLTFPSSLFLMFQNFQPLFPTYPRLPRLAIILSFCCVAMVLPRFGDFLALFGAIANSLCIYILPHMAFLAHAKDQDLGLRRVACWTVMLIFGLCGGLLSCVISLEQLA